MAKSCLAVVITLLILLCCGLLGGLLYFVLKEKPTCPQPQKLDKATTCKAVADTSSENSGETDCMEIITKFESDDLCLTPDCTLTASTFISAMNTSLDPCLDFYEFSCSKFIKKHLVPEEEESFTTWDVFNTFFDLQMKEIIEKLDPYNEPNVVARVQEAYHVCINTSYQEEIEFDAFKNFTVETVRWPLSSGKKWKYGKDSVNDIIMYLESMKLDNPYFYLMAYRRYDNDSSPLDFRVRSKNFKGIYDEEDISEEDKKMKIVSNKEFIDAIEDMAELLGDGDQESIKSDLQYMKLVSYKYKEISEQMDKKPDTDEEDDGSDKDDNGDDDNEERETVEPMEMTMTFQKLTSFCYNKIKWIEIYNIKLEKDGSTFKVSKTDNITVYGLKDMKILCRLIDNYPLRVMNNLYGTSLIFELGKHAGPLVEPIYRIYKSIQQENNDESISTSRWKYCLDIIQTAYPMVLTRIFVNEYIVKKDKADADEMIQLIQESYKTMISESDWVDSETKDEALIKADAITRHVAYPDLIFDKEAIDRLYSDMPNITSIHFNNVLFHLLERQEIMDTMLSNESWRFYPLVINAFYNPWQNAIWFPTGILQLPFFDSTRLSAVNFGMIGSIIGHEIGHAFDNMGSQYDGQGERRNWWTNETLAKFKNKTECFINQYNNFCPEELQGGNETFCVNGERTLGENLADFTGIRAAFAAYKLWVEKHGSEKRLPGLQQFSPEQLFFIGYAYNWCENVPPDKWVDRYKYDPHSAGRYRVLGPLSNNEDFRKTFNCEEGKMNRGKDSCTMW